MNWIKRIKENEQGQAIPLFALMTVVLFGFAALSFDVGRMAYTKAKLQKIADASALAAAMDIPPIRSDGTYYDNPVGSVNLRIIATGEAYAVDNGMPSNLVDADATVVTPEISQRRVTVTVQENINHFFARLLNVNSTNLSATAVAQRYAIWDGNVLPIVNMNEDYTPGKPLDFQEKWDGSSSDRDWLLINAYMTAQGVTRIEDLTIDPTKGLLVDNGEVDNYFRNYLEPLLSYEGPYYIYSVSKAAFEKIEAGKGLAVIDQNAKNDTRFLTKNDGFKNKDTIAPYAKEVGGKMVPCGIEDKADPTFIEQIVILELGDASASEGPGGGATTSVSGDVTAVHSITSFFEPRETEVGLVKARLVD